MTFDKTYSFTRRKEPPFKSHLLSVSNNLQHNWTLANITVNRKLLQLQKAKVSCAFRILNRFWWRIYRAGPSLKLNHSLSLNHNQIHNKPNNKAKLKKFRKPPHSLKNKDSWIIVSHVLRSCILFLFSSNKCINQL